MRAPLKVTVLTGVSAAAGLVICEILLRVATTLPVTAWSNQVPDDELLYVVDSGLPDVDERGFRNSAVLPIADIVTIGDSHTYGYNARSDDSWPAQLGRMTGRSLYNLGIPSYGIYQYAALIDEAVKRHPSYVILGLFPANDLQGPVGCAILAQPAWEERIERLGLETPSSCDVSTLSPPAEFSAGRLYDWLVVNTAVVNLVDRAITRPEAIAVGPSVVTRALIRDHVAATDLTTELNSTHLRNASRILAYMAETARLNGTKLSVLIIPSKERVLAKQEENPEVQRALVQEANLIAELEKTLDALGVAHADATPRMAEMASAQSYPPFDGHPFAEGYRVYAETAHGLLH